MNASGAASSPSVMSSRYFRHPARTSGAISCAATASGGEVAIERRLITASARAVDKKFLDPTFAAVAGKNQASVTNTGTTVPPGANTAASVSALVSTFFAQRPKATRPVFVAGPATAAAVSGSGNHPGLPGSLLGLPVVVSVGAGSTLVLLDAAGIYVNDAGGEVDTSRYAAIQADSAPANR